MKVGADREHSQESYDQTIGDIVWQTCVAYDHNGILELMYYHKICLGFPILEPVRQGLNHGSYIVHTLVIRTTFAKSPLLAILILTHNIHIFGSYPHHDFQRYYFL